MPNSVSCIPHNLDWWRPVLGDNKHSSLIPIIAAGLMAEPPGFVAVTGAQEGGLIGGWLGPAQGRLAC